MEYKLLRMIPDAPKFKTQIPRELAKWIQKNKNLYPTNFDEKIPRGYSNDEFFHHFAVWWLGKYPNTLNESNEINGSNGSNGSHISNMTPNITTNITPNITQNITPNRTTKITPNSTDNIEDEKDIYQLVPLFEVCIS